MPFIKRDASNVNVTIPINLAVPTDPMDFRIWAGGAIIIPSAWTAANIGFQVSRDSDGTFVTLKDEDGLPVQIGNVTTNAVKAYVIPSGVFGVGWVKIWSKSSTAATDTSTNQGAERALPVLLKT